MTLNHKGSAEGTPAKRASMSLTSVQADLLKCLRSAVGRQPSLRIVYCTAWLGYLPFGLYHWVEVGGRDISNSFPSDWAFDWERTDLDRLEEARFLVKLCELQNSEDELETRVTYELP
ncbi:MAG: hypothetical protein CMJ48_04095 [Planctomycetaceae bacterium]|nr:hypothetical protein [Planctomycetaceae bacterium]